jgi:hypothetical protein
MRIAPLGLSLATRSFAATDSDPAVVPATFPTQPPELVKEMVGVSHGNIQRVRELLTAHPSLAKAAWDWGFGDWETALGAASHVGNREIAELLLANGAHPTIFSAAMLGHLDTVKAFVAARPGIQRTAGPHSISLLAHAKNGGAPAEPVLRYLESLGDAGANPAAPLTEAEATALAGIYVFGTGAQDRVEVTVSKGQLMFLRQGGTARGLVHVGEHAFYPVGSAAVRIRFTPQGSLMKLTVHDPEVILTAMRSAA